MPDPNPTSAPILKFKQHYQTVSKKWGQEYKEKVSDTSTPHLHSSPLPTRRQVRHTNNGCPASLSRQCSIEHSGDRRHEDCQPPNAAILICIRHTPTNNGQHSSLLSRMGNHRGQAREAGWRTGGQWEGEEGLPYKLADWLICAWTGQHAGRKARGLFSVSLPVLVGMGRRRKCLSSHLEY